MKPVCSGETRQEFSETRTGQKISLIFLAIKSYEWQWVVSSGFGRRVVCAGGNFRTRRPRLGSRGFELGTSTSIFRKVSYTQVSVKLKNCNSFHGPLGSPKPTWKHSNPWNYWKLIPHMTMFLVIVEKVASVLPWGSGIVFSPDVTNRLQFIIKLITQINRIFS